MLGMYMLGFAFVWAAVVMVSAAVAWFGHFEDNWDRAFKRELLGGGGASLVESELRKP